MIPKLAVFFLAPGTTAETDHDDNSRTGDGVTQIFESARDGLASHAELLSGGRISMSLRGAVPQGEEDTLRVARILIAMLNASGEDWLQPELSNGAADFESRSRAVPHLVFRGQVIRAIAAAGFWKHLAQGAMVGGSWTRVCIWCRRRMVVRLCVRVAYGKSASNLAALCIAYALKH